MISVDTVMAEGNVMARKQAEGKADLVTVEEKLQAGRLELPEDSLLLRWIFEEIRSR
jgi:hypothetical protein